MDFSNPSVSCLKIPQYFPHFSFSLGGTGAENPLFLALTNDNVLSLSQRSSQIFIKDSDLFFIKGIVHHIHVDTTEIKDATVRFSRSSEALSLSVEHKYGSYHIEFEDITSRTKMIIQTNPVEEQTLEFISLGGLALELTGGSISDIVQIISSAGEIHFRTTYLDVGDLSGCGTISCIGDVVIIDAISCPSDFRLEVEGYLEVNNNVDAPLIISLNAFGISVTTASINSLEVLMTGENISGIPGVVIDGSASIVGELLTIDGIGSPGVLIDGNLNILNNSIVIRGSCMTQGNRGNQGVVFGSGTIDASSLEINGSSDVTLNISDAHGVEIQGTSLNVSSLQIIGQAGSGTSAIGIIFNALPNSIYDTVTMEGIASSGILSVGVQLSSPILGSGIELGSAVLNGFGPITGSDATGILVNVEASITGFNNIELNAISTDPLSFVTGVNIASVSIEAFNAISILSDLIANQLLSSGANIGVNIFGHLLGVESISILSTIQSTDDLFGITYEAITTNFCSMTTKVLQINGMISGSLDSSLTAVTLESSSLLISETLSIGGTSTSGSGILIRSSEIIAPSFGCSGIGLVDGILFENTIVNTGGIADLLGSGTRFGVSLQSGTTLQAGTVLISGISATISPPIDREAFYLSANSNVISDTVTIQGSGGTSSVVDIQGTVETSVEDISKLTIVTIENVTQFPETLILFFNCRISGYDELDIDAIGSTAGNGFVSISADISVRSITVDATSKRTAISISDPTDTFIISASDVNLIGSAVESGTGASIFGTFSVEQLFVNGTGSPGVSLGAQITGDYIQVGGHYLERNDKIIEESVGVLVANARLDMNEIYIRGYCTFSPFVVNHANIGVDIASGSQLFGFVLSIIGIAEGGSGSTGILSKGQYSSTYTDVTMNGIAISETASTGIQISSPIQATGGSGTLTLEGNVLQISGGVMVNIESDITGFSSVMLIAGSAADTFFATGIKISNGAVIDASDIDIISSLVSNVAAAGLVDVAGVYLDTCTLMAANTITINSFVQYNIVGSLETANAVIINNSLLTSASTLLIHGSVLGSFNYPIISLTITLSTIQCDIFDVVGISANGSGVFFESSNVQSTSVSLHGEGSVTGAILELFINTGNIQIYGIGEEFGVVFQNGFSLLSGEHLDVFGTISGNSVLPFLKKGILIEEEATLQCNSAYLEGSGGNVVVDIQGSIEGLGGSLVIFGQDNVETSDTLVQLSGAKIANFDELSISVEGFFLLSRIGVLMESVDIDVLIMTVEANADEMAITIVDDPLSVSTIIRANQIHLTGTTDMGSGVSIYLENGSIICLDDFIIDGIGSNGVQLDGVIDAGSLFVTGTFPDGLPSNIATRGIVVNSGAQLFSQAITLVGISGAPSISVADDGGRNIGVEIKNGCSLFTFNLDITGYASTGTPSIGILFDAQQSFAFDSVLMYGTSIGSSGSILGPRGIQIASPIHSTNFGQITLTGATEGSDMNGVMVNVEADITGFATVSLLTDVFFGVAAPTGIQVNAMISAEENITMESSLTTSKDMPSGINLVDCILSSANSISIESSILFTGDIYTSLSFQAISMDSCECNARATLIINGLISGDSGSPLVAVHLNSTIIETEILNIEGDSSSGTGILMTTSEVTAFDDMVLSGQGSYHGTLTDGTVITFDGSGELHGTGGKLGVSLQNGSILQTTNHLDIIGISTMLSVIDRFAISISEDSSIECQSAYLEGNGGDRAISMEGTLEGDAGSLFINGLEMGQSPFVLVYVSGTISGFTELNISAEGVTSQVGFMCESPRIDVGVMAVNGRGSESGILITESLLMPSMISTNEVQLVGTSASSTEFAVSISLESGSVFASDTISITGTGPNSVSLGGNINAERIEVYGIASVASGVLVTDTAHLIAFEIFLQGIGSNDEILVATPRIGVEIVPGSRLFAPNLTIIGSAFAGSPTIGVLFQGDPFTYELVSIQGASSFAGPNARGIQISSSMHSAVLGNIFLLGESNGLYSDGVIINVEADITGFATVTMSATGNAFVTGIRVNNGISIDAEDISILSNLVNDGIPTEAESGMQFLAGCSIAAANSLSISSSILYTDITSSLDFDALLGNDCMFSAGTALSISGIISGSFDSSLTGVALNNVLLESFSLDIEGSTPNGNGILILSGDISSSDITLSGQGSENGIILNGIILSCSGDSSIVGTGKHGVLLETAYLQSTGHLAIFGTSPANITPADRVAISISEDSVIECNSVNLEGHGGKETVIDIQGLVQGFGGNMTILVEEEFQGVNVVVSISGPITGFNVLHIIAEGSSSTIGLLLASPSIHVITMNVEGKGIFSGIAINDSEFMASTISVEDMSLEGEAEFGTGISIFLELGSITSLGTFSAIGIGSTGISLAGSINADVFSVDGSGVTNGVAINAHLLGSIIFITGSVNPTGVPNQSRIGVDIAPGSSLFAPVLAITGTAVQGSPSIGILFNADPFDYDFVVMDGIAAIGHVDSRGIQISSPIQSVSSGRITLNGQGSDLSDGGVLVEVGGDITGFGSVIITANTIFGLHVEATGIRVDTGVIINAEEINLSSDLTADGVGSSGAGVYLLSGCSLSAANSISISSIVEYSAIVPTSLGILPVLASDCSLVAGTLLTITGTISGSFDSNLNAVVFFNVLTQSDTLFIEGTGTDHGILIVLSQIFSNALIFDGVGSVDGIVIDDTSIDCLGDVEIHGSGKELGVSFENGFTLQTTSHVDIVGVSNPILIVESKGIFISEDSSILCNNATLAGSGGDAAAVDIQGTMNGLNNSGNLVITALDSNEGQFPFILMKLDGSITGFNVLHITAKSEASSIGLLAESVTIDVLEIIIEVNAMESGIIIFDSVEDPSIVTAAGSMHLEGITTGSQIGVSISLLSGSITSFGDIFIHGSSAIGVYVDATISGNEIVVLGDFIGLSSVINSTGVFVSGNSHLVGSTITISGSSNTNIEEFVWDGIGVDIAEGSRLFAPTLDINASVISTNSSCIGIRFNGQPFDYDSMIMNGTITTFNSTAIGIHLLSPIHSSSSGNVTLMGTGTTFNSDAVIVNVESDISGFASVVLMTSCSNEGINPSGIKCSDGVTINAENNINITGELVTRSGSIPGESLPVVHFLAGSNIISENISISSSIEYTASSSVASEMEAITANDCLFTAGTLAINGTISGSFNSLLTAVSLDRITIESNSLDIEGSSANGSGILISSSIISSGDLSFSGSGSIDGTLLVNSNTTCLGNAAICGSGGHLGVSFSGSETSLFQSTHLDIIGLSVPSRLDLVTAIPTGRSVAITTSLASTIQCNSANLQGNGGEIFVIDIEGIIEGFNSLGELVISAPEDEILASSHLQIRLSSIVRGFASFILSSTHATTMLSGGSISGGNMEVYLAHNGTEPFACSFDSVVISVLSLLVEVNSTNTAIQFTGDTRIDVVGEVLLKGVGENGFGLSFSISESGHFNSPCIGTNFIVEGKVFVSTNQLPECSGDGSLAFRDSFSYESNLVFQKSSGNIVFHGDISSGSGAQFRIEFSENQFDIAFLGFLDIDELSILGSGVTTMAHERDEGSIFRVLEITNESGSFHLGNSLNIDEFMNVACPTIIPLKSVIITCMTECQMESIDGEARETKSLSAGSLFLHTLSSSPFLLQGSVGRTIPLEEFSSLGNIRFGGPTGRAEVITNTLISLHDGDIQYLPASQNMTLESPLIHISGTLKEGRRLIAQGNSTFTGESFFDFLDLIGHASISNDHFNSSVQMHPGSSLYGEGRVRALSLDGSKFLPIGCFLVTGEFLFHNLPSEVIIEIDGIDRCSEYSAIHANEISLGEGLATLQVIASAIPGLSDEFLIMEYSSLDGTFINGDVLLIDEELAFLVNYTFINEEGSTFVQLKRDSIPLGTPDFYEIFSDSELIVESNEGLLANDEDPDSPLLLVTAITPPDSNLVFQSNGSFVFHSNSTIDSFVYTYDVFDGLLSSTSTLTINVISPSASISPSPTISISETVSRSSSLPSAIPELASTTVTISPSKSHSSVKSQTGSPSTSKSSSNSFSPTKSTSFSPSLSPSPSSSSTKSRSQSGSSSRSSSATKTISLTASRTISLSQLVNPSIPSTPSISGTPSTSFLPSNPPTTSPSLTSSPERSTSRNLSVAPSIIFSLNSITPPPTVSSLANIPFQPVISILPSVSLRVTSTSMNPVVACASCETNSFTHDLFFVGDLNEQGEEQDYQRAQVVVDINDGRGEVVGILTIPNGVEASTVTFTLITNIPEGNELQLGNTVVDIVLRDENGVELTSFDDPLEICLVQSSKSDIEEYCLSFFNEATGRWECQDDCLKKVGNQVCGFTDHLTSFALLLSGKSGDLCGSSSIDYLFTWLSLTAVGMAILFTVFGLIIVEIVVRRRSAKRKAGLRAVIVTVGNMSNI